MQKKLSHQGSVFMNTLGCVCIWVIQTQLGWDKLGFEGWEVEIYQCVRVGDLGAQTKTKPLGLGFREGIAEVGGFR